MVRTVSAFSWSLTILNAFLLQGRSPPACSQTTTFPQLVAVRPRVDWLWKTDWLYKPTLLLKSWRAVAIKKDQMAHILCLRNFVGVLLLWGKSFKQLFYFIIVIWECATGTSHPHSPNPTLLLPSTSFHPTPTPNPHPQHQVWKYLLTLSDNGGATYSRVSSF